MTIIIIFLSILFLYNFKNCRFLTSEIKEGPTYESGIDLSGNDNCLEVIPDNASPPCMTSNPKPNCSFLYFDLETTGFGKLFNLKFTDLPKTGRFFV